ncbi:hypothetical protein L596_023223 [Steinernema carpocapsae]|uniref:Uncharacterized protein n=1 Tax=Steinernema carpocapsae TaxID=34508 RepID=A0A4U5MD04_STECR|nr:hypothetical protein L596_023223 [Steinernema carpocapsae]
MAFAFVILQEDKNMLSVAMELTNMPARWENVGSVKNLLDGFDAPNFGESVSRQTFATFDRMSRYWFVIILFIVLF